MSSPIHITLPFKHFISSYRLAIATQTSLKLTVLMEKRSSQSRLGKVAVIGGCGFLGHHIVKQLLEDGTCVSIAVMSRHPYKNTFEGVSYRVGDITSRPDVDVFVKDIKPDTIINTASPVAYIDHIHAPDYEKVNVGGNENLLAAAKAVGTVKAYVYTSSGPIIAGAGGAYDLADESYPTLATLRGGGDPTISPRREGMPWCWRPMTAVACARLRSAPLRCMERATSRWSATCSRYCRPASRPCGWAITRRSWTACTSAPLRTPTYSPRMPCTRASWTPPRLKSMGEAFNITDDEPQNPWSFFRRFWIEMGDTTPLSKVWIIPSWVALLMSEFAEWYTWFFSFGRLRPKVLIKERIEFLLYTRTYDIRKARNASAIARLSL